MGQQGNTERARVLAEGRAFVRWAWRWIVLVLFLLSVAFAFVYLCSSRDLVFTGFLVNNDDHQLYLSFMREGVRGSWLTTVRTTSEDHDAALLLSGYLVVCQAPFSLWRKLNHR
jgi:hypothetical protein